MSGAVELLDLANAFTVATIFGAVDFGFGITLIAAELCHGGTTGPALEDEALAATASGGATSRTTVFDILFIK